MNNGEKLSNGKDNDYMLKCLYLVKSNFPLSNYFYCIMFFFEIYWLNRKFKNN